jgi:hypothetical protein
VSSFFKWVKRFFIKTKPQVAIVEDTEHHMWRSMLVDHRQTKLLENLQNRPNEHDESFALRFLDDG